MRIYLDLCCFNRPYDDQTQARIHLETEAKLLLQQKVKNAECDLIWSSVLDFECKNNPFEEHRHAILQWRWLAKEVVMTKEQVILQSGLEACRQRIEKLRYSIGKTKYLFPITSVQLASFNDEQEESIDP